MQRHQHNLLTKDSSMNSSLPPPSNEKAVPERERLSLKAQIETASCPNTPSRHPHLSTTILDDEQDNDLIEDIVRTPVTKLERGNCHG